MDIKAFEKLPLMGILRGVEEYMIEPLTECVIASGITTIEITMNTHNAAHLIRKMSTFANGRLMIGAGTVLNIGELNEAIHAGASFIVMPCTIMPVVEQCVKNRIPVFPGAFTPQEIFNAWNAGASMVKVFPAKFFGPTYFKEIKAPFNKIKLMACGGVSDDNLSEFLRNGADAVSFGASIFNIGLLKDNKYDVIQQKLAVFVRAYNNRQ